ncbi:hypothetical protein [Streptomyces sp. NPDC053560]
MRNTKAFKDAVARTLAELARKGVTMGPTMVTVVIEARRGDRRTAACRPA